MRWRPSGLAIELEPARTSRSFPCVKVKACVEEGTLVFNGDIITSHGESLQVMKVDSAWIGIDSFGKPFLVDEIFLNQHYYPVD